MISKKKNFEVICGPESTSVIQSNDFETKVNIKLDETSFKFKPFMSSNNKCPIKSYEINTKVDGVKFAKGRSYPNNELEFERSKIKGDLVKIEILVRSEGDGTYLSSQIEILFEKETKPKWVNPLVTIS